MTTIIGDITMSLDGYVTGPDPDPAHGLGHDADDLHAWALESDADVDAEVLRSHSAASGAVVMGRRTWDTVDGPQGWSDELGYGAREAAHEATSFFVVTATPPESVRLAVDVTFVTTPGEAVRRAREAAGPRDVFVMGGAATLDSCLAEGLLDELRLHLSPELLGSGTPLFAAVGRHRLVQTGVAVSPVAVHLTYAVTRATAASAVSTSAGSS